MLFSKSFTVSPLTFRSLIHFEIIFLKYSVRQGFILFRLDIHLSQNHCGKDNSFPIELSWNICKKKKSIVKNVWFYFWSINSVPKTYVPVFTPVPHCVDGCSFVLRFGIEKIESSNFVTFQDSLVYSGTLIFLYKFQNHLLNSCKESTRDFYRNCIEYIDK